MRLGDFLADESGGEIQIETREAAALPPWTVKGTKKGSVPVQVESRRNGKVVVISNVCGDINALLADVKRALGTGGVARPDDGYIEIQGGHHETKVRDFLLRSGRLVGVNKNDISRASGSKKTQGATANKKLEGKASLNAKGGPPPPKAITVDSSDTLDSRKVKAMKPPQLKAHLQARGLSTQGNKKELISRLLAK